MAAHNRKIQATAKNSIARWRQCFVATFLVATLGVAAEAAPITFNDPTVTTRDGFGFSVALDGNNIPIGAYRDGTLGFDVGQAHLYSIPDPPTLRLGIRPGSDPNSIDLKSRGVLSVAILGTDVFDPLDVDVDSLLFGDPLLIDAGHLPVEPLRSSLDDVNDDGLVNLALNRNYS